MLLNKLPRKMEPHFKTSPIKLPVGLVEEPVAARVLVVEKYLTSLQTFKLQWTKPQKMH
jgi:hypothetical protein